MLLVPDSVSCCQVLLLVPESATCCLLPTIRFRYWYEKPLLDSLLLKRLPGSVTCCAISYSFRHCLAARFRCLLRYSEHRYCTLRVTDLQNNRFERLTANPMRRTRLPSAPITSTSLELPVPSALGRDLMGSWIDFRPIPFRAEVRCQAALLPFDRESSKVVGRLLNTEHATCHSTIEPNFRLCRIVKPPWRAAVSGNSLDTTKGSGSARRRRGRATPPSRRPAASHCRRTRPTATGRCASAPTQSVTM